MIVTALVDNSRLENRPDLGVERGLSLHISTMGKQLLFDAGSGQTFCDNAARLGIRIQDVDAVAISHRHHDHCNGVSHFIDRNTSASIYFRDCESQDYRFKAFGFSSNVGIDKSLLDELLFNKSLFNKGLFDKGLSDKGLPGKNNTQLNLIQDTTEILPNVFLITNINQKYPQPKGNQYLYTESENGCQHDSFDHELMMVVKEEDGLIVFTGCAHNGVLNMVDTAVTLFPDTRIKAVVGGFHLVGLPVFNSIGGSKEDIREIGKQLLSYPIDKLYTGHCTGMKAFGLLKEVLGDKLEHLPTGRRVDV
ncbi:MBL fold metallo-hydrolase [Photobacterium sanguinicancri]|uniref:MBL fold metallo-hydrolase n=1 Tax=Photobacterium sanguinicancri TaxID=875932 RepID=A0AAW7Y7U5_9GAMM|nr:MBL fold metallo-hydrolase [Photobacterium sanguinicancri]MDO6544703.1 MBL fold metallo-hydrolase [Photobacterium sanguinicancri]